MANSSTSDSVIRQEKDNVIQLDVEKQLSDQHVPPEVAVPKTLGAGVSLNEM